MHCIATINLYIVSHSAHRSEALPVQETKKEESNLERTKRALGSPPDNEEERVSGWSWFESAGPIIIAVMF